MMNCLQALKRSDCQILEEETLPLGLVVRQAANADTPK
jgi:hypothetical protein